VTFLLSPKAGITFWVDEFTSCLPPTTMPTNSGSPTFHVTDNGKKVDWYSYSGYRRYHAECHVCHGPDVVGVELVGQRRIRLRIGFLGILSMYGSRADGC
jgi:hypothetical protein